MTRSGVRGAAAVLGAVLMLALAFGLGGPGASAAGAATTTGSSRLTRSFPLGAQRLCCERPATTHRSAPATAAATDRVARAGLTGLDTALLIAVGLLVIVAGALAVVAVREHRRAEREAALARSTLQGLRRAIAVIRETRAREAEPR